MREVNLQISNLLGNRLDAIFYCSNPSLKTKYKTVKLKDVCIDFRSGFGAGKTDQVNAHDGIIQIRPTNIDNQGFLKFDKNIYVPHSESTPLLEIDDVLFNNTNSQELVGKTAIVKDNIPLTFSNHITRIRVNTSIILPDYLWIVLNIFQENNIFYAIATNWNNQSGVGIELLKLLEIPLPEIKEQFNIIYLYENAYKKKFEKEKEANELLNSIDNYLLNELGVVLPQDEQDERFFNIKISQLIGHRFDVTSYRSTFSLNTSFYRVVKLSDVVTFNPTVKFDGLAPDEEISFIPMDIVDEKKGTVFSHLTKTVLETKGFTKFENRDIIWAKITPCMQNKKSAIVDNLMKGKGCGSTEFYILRANKDFLISDFLLYILRLEKLLSAAQLAFGGSAGQQRVPITFLKDLEIPLPPLNKQIEVVRIIQQKIEVATKLELESITMLQHTKKNIVNMIINL
ncbi:restriction endonuclease subunit S [Dysgonomonas sp. Marseille-P4677]|uniref:restriction endonuclease subunit S n=1 Tax=Dysgonomonas sp. Marseille-P4677 TaxID=2364790 RepID=UPI001F23A818|nr:restriction endonuclease subunit S [Dysgonomonas sp. Marseille-P4677]